MAVGWGVGVGEGVGAAGRDVGVNVGKAVAVAPGVGAGAAVGVAAGEAVGRGDEVWVGLGVGEGAPPPEQATNNRVVSARAEAPKPNRRSKRKNPPCGLGPLAIIGYGTCPEG